MPVGANGEVKLALVFSETEFSEHLMLPAIDRVVHADQGCLSDRCEVRARSIAQNRAYLDLFIKFLDGGDEADDDERDGVGHEPDDPAGARTALQRPFVRRAQGRRAAVTGTTRNLSTGGVCVEIDRPVAGGQGHPH